MNTPKTKVNHKMCKLGVATKKTIFDTLICERASLCSTTCLGIRECKGEHFFSI